MRTKAFCIAIVALGACLALWAAPGWAQAGGDNYQQLAKREFGTAAEALEAINKEIQAAKPGEYPAIEAKLLAVIDSPEATMAGKQFACQALKTIASVKAVGSMARLLADEKLSHVARCVLAVMPDPSAGQALCKGLAATKGAQQVGVINSLGDRKEAQAVDALAGLIGADPAVNQAALRALGKIGGAAAASAIEKAKVPDSCKDAQAGAMIACGETLIAADAARAEKMFRSVMGGSCSPPAKAAAFVALIGIQKDQAVPMVLQAMQSKDANLRRAAGAVIITITGPAAGKAFAKELANLPAEGKVSLLAALTARGEAEGLTQTVNALVADPDAAVKLAAVRALARLGDASSVKVLAAATKEADPVGPAAAQTLARMQGPGVADAMVAAAGEGQPQARIALINILAERRQVEAIPLARKAARDSDAKVRQAGLKLLGAIGAQQDMPALVDLLLACKDDSDREAMAQALASIGSRQQDREKRTECIIAGLAKADEKAKVKLLTVLSNLGGEQALQTMRACLAGQGEVKKTAVRTLAEWPTPAPLADLLAAAKAEKDPAVQILALRGYVRLAGLSKIGNNEKLQAFAQAMQLAQRTEEKKLVLAGLGEVKDPKALKAVLPLLENDELKNEAFAAYDKIAHSLTRSNPKEAKEALTLLGEKAPDNGMRDRAKQAASKIK